MEAALLSGAEIKRLRKQARLTQKELARKAGLSQSLVARIEGENVDPRLSTINKLLAAMSKVEIKRTASQTMHSPVVCVHSSDTVKKAVELMDKHGISQMPVIDRGQVVGAILETTLTKSVLRSRDPDKMFKTVVREVTEDGFPSVGPSVPIEELFAFYSADTPALLVVDQGKPVGIITKIDLVKAFSK
ncbi:MAG: CBS domain-containing protein [Candidatus Bathyarchaeia archaeon]